jgi:hypothetical protein
LGREAEQFSLSLSERGGSEGGLRAIDHEDRGRAVLPFLSVTEAGVRVVFERSTTKREAEQFSPLPQ